MELLRQHDIMGILQFWPPRESGTKEDCALANLPEINPITGNLYIPGSSLRKELRRLSPNKGSEEAALLFGDCVSKADNNGAPLRLVIRDALPLESTIKNLAAIRTKLGVSKPPYLAATGLLKEYLENASPPLEFALQMGVRIYDDTWKQEEALIECVLEALAALDKKAYGGEGRMMLKNISLEEKPIEFIN